MATTQPNVAELVEKLPATDKELEAQKGTPPDQPKRRQRNELGGSKFTGPDPAVANRLCEDVLAGGEGSVAELIALIRDPAADDFTNYKPEYLLHCLTIYVGRPDQQARRKMFITALAVQLANQKLPSHTRGFLIRELQLIGDADATTAIGRVLGDEQLCVDAAAALAAIGNGAAGQLRAALPGAKGKCRLVIVQNLGVLRDGASVTALRQAVGDADQNVRLAAAWGLAQMGDAGSAALLLKAADATDTWERNKATQACLVLAENLASAGKKQEAAKIYTHLQNTRTDPKEQYIRDAATKALKELGGNVA